MIGQDRDTRGFSLIEVLVTGAIASIVLFSLFKLGLVLSKQQSQSTTTFQADSVRRSLVTFLNGSNSWGKTIASVKNNRSSGSALDCLANQTPCTTDGLSGGTPIANYPVHAILDASGGVFYDSSDASAGFTMHGSPCNGFIAAPAAGNDNCPLRYKITWSALCSGSSCINPQVSLSVNALYNPGSPGKTIAFNTANYSSTFVQGGTGSCNWSNLNGNLYENCANFVGIGTTTPIRQLQVTTPTGSSEMILEVADGAADRKKWNIFTGGGAGNGQELYFRLLNDAGNAGTLSLALSDRYGGMVNAPNVLAVGSTFPIGGTNPNAFIVNTAGDIIVNGGNDRRFGFYLANVPMGSVAPTHQVFSITDNPVKSVTFNWPVAIPSDERLKSEIKPLAKSLQKILGLEGVSFRWRDKERFDEEKHLGLLAQAVGKVFPEAIRKDTDGFLKVEYTALIAPIIQAIKDFHAQWRVDHERVTKLEAEVQALKIYLCAKEPEAPPCH